MLNELPGLKDTNSLDQGLACLYKRQHNTDVCCHCSIPLSNKSDTTPEDQLHSG